MAIVPYLEENDVAPADRDILARPINLFKSTVNSPEAARRLHSVGHWIRWDCELDPRLRELAILTVGYISQAPYEWSHHVKISQDFGVTEKDIGALVEWVNGKSRPSFTSQEIAVLSAARELTTDNSMSDETVRQLKGFLSDSLLVDLVTIVAHYNCVVRVLGGLRVDVEPEYQLYLDQFPL